MNNIYESHPLASLLPAMQPAEYEALKDDIAINGLVDPIIIYQGMILDGRHRYRACRETGRRLRTMQFAGTDPIAFVRSKMTGRHLTASQKACVAVAIAKANAAHAKKHHSGKSADMAGAAVGVSTRYVTDAISLSRLHPELFDRVFAGTLTLTRAKSIINKKHRRRTRNAAKRSGVHTCPTCGHTTYATAKKREVANV